MAAEQDDRLFDVRVLEHRMRRGVISREEYDKYLAKLVDEADEGIPTATRFNDAYWQRHYGPDAEDEEGQDT